MYGALWSKVQLVVICLSEIILTVFVVVNFHIFVDLVRVYISYV